MRSSFASLACAATVVLCAAAQTGSVPREIAGRLTANGLKADVSFLASDALQGRATPSPGLEIAAEYVAAQFRRAGLEPAGDDGYFQDAEYVSVRPNADGPELTLDLGGETLRPPKSALRLRNAAALDITHAPVFKASLDDPDSMQRIGPEQVRGRVLLLDATTSSATALAALRGLPDSLRRWRPAVAIVVRSGDPPPGSGPEETREGSAVPVPILTVFDDAFRNATADMPPGPGKATVTARIPAPALTPVRLRNVIGVLRGSDDALRDTCVILSAHYDHLGVRGAGEGDRIYNGANDNASGTASVVEIANTLAALPVWPRRSIVFIAFFGEELGMVGSRYYVRHPVFPLAKTVADINLEQMGRTDDSTGPHIGMLNVTGYDFSTVTAAVRAAGEETGIRVLKDEQASDVYFKSSDNLPFAEAGVPAHTLSVAYEFPDYHAPGDEWAKIDYDNMARVDRAVAVAAFRIADSAEAPRWNAADPATERYVRAREAGGAGSGPKTK